jgi:hypothetical protein
MYLFKIYLYFNELINEKTSTPTSVF